MAEQHLDRAAEEDATQLASGAVTSTASPAVQATPSPVVPPAGVPAGMTPSATAQVTPSENGRQLVYALGKLNYDFGTEANRDWFSQRGKAFAKEHEQLSGFDPDNPADMLGFIGGDLAYSIEEMENPVTRRLYYYAQNLIWTLEQEDTAIYAIQPDGPFASQIYAWMRVFLRGQAEEGVELNSFPGIIGGDATLLNGQSVPVIYPDLRGIFSWSLDALAAKVFGAPSGEDSEEETEQRSKLFDFMYRVFYELRNMGISPHDRSLNFAATHAFQEVNIFKDPHLSGLALDSIEAEQSPICRPGSDCWDVKVTFYDPENLNRARHVHRITVDVSQVMPVLRGEPRHFTVR